MKNLFNYAKTFLIAFLLLIALSGPISAREKSQSTVWNEDYITKVPPILMRDPFLELLGQTDRPVQFHYHEAVKDAGHSCGAVAGAWIITRKALEALYPSAIPVRGQIKVTLPGAQDEWFIGVFGKVISLITGAEPKTGFPGAEFGEKYNRRNLMVYAKTPKNKPPPKMIWLFERLDTHQKVAVRYDLRKIKPPATPAFNEMTAKVAMGKATPEEAAKWRKAWNDRARFIFGNADILPGLFTVKSLQ